jgi:hypothetical protein
MSLIFEILELFERLTENPGREQLIFLCSAAAWQDPDCRAWIFSLVVVHEETCREVVIVHGHQAAVGRVYK